MDVGYHPVLDMQSALKAGVMPTTAHGTQAVGGGSNNGTEYKPCNLQVAGLVLAAIIVLLLLRLGGFRFSFGGNIGG